MFSNTLSPVTLTMTKSAPETDELEALRRLEPQAIGVIYDRYFPDVFRFVRYRLESDDLAEDISSETFMRLLQASQQGRGPQLNIRAWLLSAASHIITDHLRKQYRHPTESINEEQPDTSQSPAASAEANEQKRILQSALSRLTPEQQSVIALRFGQGFSLEETAKALQKNINAVKQLQLRALAALNRHMGQKL